MCCNNPIHCCSYFFEQLSVSSVRRKKICFCFSLIYSFSVLFIYIDPSFWPVSFSLKEIILTMQLRSTGGRYFSVLFFFFLRKYFFFLHTWKIVSLDTKFYVGGFPLSTLLSISFYSFLNCMVFGEKPQLFLILVLVYSYSSCHCLHSVFPFYLVFYSLNMIMPLHRVFRIYPAWFVWASWICSLVFVLNFGKFLVIITSNVSYAPYTLSSPSIITFRHIAFVISFDILFL